MKKSLFSLVGIVLSTGFVWVTNAAVDISDLFDGETPLVDDAYQRVLNDYDSTRWYANSYILDCTVNDKIRISSNIIEDSYFDEAYQYILFVSPYTVDKIKNGDVSVDYSKMIMKRVTLTQPTDPNAVIDSIYFDIFGNEIDANSDYYWVVVPVDIYDWVWTPSREIVFNLSRKVCTSEPESLSTITLKPWLNTFSTPAILKSISFSNGWNNISFAKMEKGQWKSLAINGGTFDKIIRPLEWFIIRNSNSTDVIMTIEYDTDNSDSLLISKNLDAGWNFLWVTTTNEPFRNIARTAATMIFDLTNWSTTNLIQLGKTFVNAANYMLWKAYAVFVNSSDWIYWWTNNYGDWEDDNWSDSTLILDDQNRLNFVLIGYWGNNWEWRHLVSDSIIVVSWDLDTNNVKLMPVPFILAYAITPEELADNVKYIISRRLWLNIQNYATMDFAAFKEAIDLLWGIDVYIDKPIVDSEFPNDLGFYNGGVQFHRDPARWYSPFIIGTGQQHLDWETALKYVRSINTTSDLGRASHQIKVLQAIQDKIEVSWFDISQLYRLYRVYNNNIVTNISLYDAFWIVRHLDEIENISYSSYCDDPMIQLACALGADSCPEWCELSANLTNKITKTVTFPSGEVSRKVVFEWTYTWLNYSSIAWASIWFEWGEDGDCHNDMIFYLYVDWEEVESIYGNMVWNSCWGTHYMWFDENVVVNRWEAVQIRIEWELNSELFGDSDEEGSYSYKLELYGDGWRFDKFATANLAPISIVDSSDEFSIQPGILTNTVLLKMNNSVLADFLLKPSNGIEGYLSSITLQWWNETTQEPINLAEAVEFRIDWTEVDPVALSRNHEFLYEIDETVPASGVDIKVTLKEAIDSVINISVYAINDDYNGFPQKTFRKRFDVALAYIDSQTNAWDETEYTLLVDTYGGDGVEYTVSNLKLYTWYDSEYDQCVGELSISGLGNVELEDGEAADFTIDNWTSAQMIKCIKYEHNYQCGEQVTCGGDIIIDKDNYPDYFKTRSWESRKVFARNSNTQCVGMDMASVNHVVNWNTITLRWTPIDGDSVSIALFNPETEMYGIVWTADMDDGSFDYEKQWNGSHYFILSNGCKDLYYRVDA